MNLLLGIMLLCGASVVGVWVANRFRQDLTLAHDFERFLIAFETNLSFSRGTIAEFVKSVSNGLSPQFRAILSDNTALSFVRNEELRALFRVFFTSIGRTDATTQLSQIQETKRLLNDLNYSLKKNEKQGALSQKLGVLGGIGLFIIVL